MKEKDLVAYRPPRRDSWLARLSEEERLDVLSTRKKMSWDKAVEYINQKYGIKVSRTSYYASTKRYASNEIAAAQLKAASTPPALDYIVKIAEAVDRIDKTLKKVLLKPTEKEKK